MKLVTMMAVSSNDETRTSARLPDPCFGARVAGLDAGSCNTGATGSISMKGSVIVAGGVCTCGIEFLDLLPNMRGM